MFFFIAMNFNIINNKTPTWYCIKRYIHAADAWSDVQNAHGINYKKLDANYSNRVAFLVILHKLIWDWKNYQKRNSVSFVCIQLLEWIPCAFCISDHASAAWIYFPLQYHAGVFFVLYWTCESTFCNFIKFYCNIAKARFMTV